MELDWDKYKYLHHYKKHSTSSYKDFPRVVDKILSFIPSIKGSLDEDSHLDDYDILKKDGSEESISVKLEDDELISVEKKEKEEETEDNTSAEDDSLPEQSSEVDNLDSDKARLKRKLVECLEADSQQIANSESVESSESCGSDLIFDMKYCSLQLPIPKDVFQEDDFTLETNTSPSITEYDVCYDEEVGSNYVMVEPFRFLCKVHVTFDKESGEQWCCCYFDAKGNYTRKRFNTSHIAFETAKMLACRCREAAEKSFHNIWILKHKNLLDRPIPENLTESFVLIVNKIKNHLANERCMVCCVDKIKQTLHSAHKHDSK